MNEPEPFKPGFIATGIGTLPHLDPQAAVDDVLAVLTDMPYWPQLPGLGPLEDMNLQYAGALTPLVEPDLAQRSLLAYPGLSREEALAAFYERLWSPDLASFGLRPQEAQGLALFVQKVGAAPAGSYPWIKGHVTGPLTFLAAAMGSNGKALLYDDEVAEAVARGLGKAAAAQVEQLSPLGRPALMFFDEPFLSGFGSAFSPISREQALALLRASFEELRQRASAVIGVHCCGNTDWSLLEEAGADVINLDSHDYGEHLLLYPESVSRLLERGGAVAWGAVPTLAYTGSETAEQLWGRLRGLLDSLEQKGIPRELLFSQSLVTPACGMGSLKLDAARAILALTAQVSRLARAAGR